MPTIKEKLESLGTHPAYRDNFTNEEWRAWDQRRNALGELIPIKAYDEALLAKIEVERKLRVAQVEADQATSKVKVLQRELEVAKHIVTVLEAVEVP